MQRLISRVLVLAALPLSLSACGTPHVMRSPVHLWREAPGQGSAGAMTSMVVEIPAGTRAKWEVDMITGDLVWERKANNTPRKLKYASPYPVHYGMVPQTLNSTSWNGDGDPLDALLVDRKSYDRAEQVAVRVVGLMRMLDNGEQDDKLICVNAQRKRYRDIHTFDQLVETYPGIDTIFTAWFSNYKLKKGQTRVTGFDGPDEALDFLDRCATAFQSQHVQPTQSGTF